MNAHLSAKQPEILPNYFGGRLIFDHLPKTGGTSFNSWLTISLGAERFRHSLIGNYTQLKNTYGQAFEFLSGHFDFDGSGLDTRYCHITCLRDPIERVLSWIFFVLNNHSEDQLQDLYRHTKQFVESHGEELSPLLLNHISNYYVEHFSRIFPSIHITNQDQIDLALISLSQYNLIGFQSNLDDFRNKVGALLNIKNSTPLKIHNNTLNSPNKFDISPALLSKLKAINTLDIAFYDLVLKNTNSDGIATKLVLPSFKKLKEKQQDDESFQLLDIFGPEIVTSNQRVRFDIEFLLPRKINSLAFGFGVFDTQKLRIFGTNSTLLNQPMNEVGPGKYQISYEFEANLFAGDYFLRVSAVEIDGSERRTIALFDEIKRFTVQIQRTQESIGVANLNASITLQKTS